MRNKIVDVFPYFDPTGRELLELRIKLLYDYVDEFVITESNRTQSGIPIERNLRNVLKEYGIPSDKIIIVDLDIPDDDNLVIEPIDVTNCYYEGASNIVALRARVRERMQKDAIRSALYRYSEDTKFICSDSDEIINPHAIGWLCDVVDQIKDTSILCVPLIHYEVRADLRVLDQASNNWVRWDPLFIATKTQLTNSTPCGIRSNYYPYYQRVWPAQNGVQVQDLGWHFSWMGDKSKRAIKLESFSHHSDINHGIVMGGYSNVDLREKIVEHEYDDGSPAPDSSHNAVLKKYPISVLPELIFDLPRVRKYLLPNLFSE